MLFFSMIFIHIAGTRHYIKAASSFKLLFSYSNLILCRDSSKHVPLHRHTIDTQQVQYLKEFFNYFIFYNLSIIKITAPEKTTVFKTFFSIDTCSLGQNPGSQTRFLSITCILGFKISTFEFECSSPIDVNGVLNVCANGRSVRRFWCKPNGGCSAHPYSKQVF